jgi:hypothetical protein
VKLRIGTLFVFLLLIGLGWSAEACELCVAAPTPGQQMCSSGWRSGFQACWGGFGAPCTPAGGDCYDASGRRREPEQNYSTVGDCPTCIEAEPDQGFMLRTIDERSEPSSQRAERD